MIVKMSTSSPIFLIIMISFIMNLPKITIIIKRMILGKIITIKLIRIMMMAIVKLMIMEIVILKIMVTITRRKKRRIHLSLWCTHSCSSSTE